MVEQFALPIVIEAGETRRAESGLALSSRNGYLSEAERAKATELLASLRTLAQRFRETGGPLETLEAHAMATLAGRGWQPDYLTLRRRADLSVPDSYSVDDGLVALGAARLGNTRLIDNIEF